MGKVARDEGSWEKGLEVMEAEMQKLGVQTDVLLLRDGSGISHVNLVPASEISNLLYTIQKKDWFASFLRALPAAGEQERMAGGTLQNRLVDISVQAKTGTIDSVSSLSGYVETKRGEKVIFSILINSLLDEECGTELEEKFVQEIASAWCRERRWNSADQ